jgi:flavin-dependent dehydrogenase
MRPLLLEREPVPRHKICGEFVSIEAQAVLRAMGIDPVALGAQPIDRLRLVHDRRVAVAALPFRAYGLTRLAMDAALLEQAAAAGADVRHGVTVREIDGLRLKTDAGDMEAGRLLLASGKHDVRGVRRVSRGTVNDLVGFKSYFKLAPDQHASLAGHIEVLLFEGGYAGLQLVEGGVANLCLLVTRDVFGRAGKDWPSLLAHLRRGCGHLDERLDGAVEQLDRPLTIAGVPYGYRHRPRSDDSPRFYRAGDQMAVIPSFSGDGMSMAMVSGRAAARAILAGADARDFHASQRVEFRRQIILAQAIYRLGQPRVLQPVLVALARRWPGIATRVAAWTRVPSAYRSNRAAPSRSISDASCVT